MKLTAKPREASMLRYGWYSSLAVALVLTSLTQTPVGGQQAPAAGRDARGSTWVVPRTADGPPDLEGVWENTSATPLERPRQLADKPRLTDEELASFERRARPLVGPEAGATLRGGL